MHDDPETEVEGDRIKDAHEVPVAAGHQHATLLRKPFSGTALAERAPALLEQQCSLASER